MAYDQQTWTDGPEGNTPTSAARLSHMEQGISDAHALGVAGSLIDVAMRYSAFNVQAVGTTMTDVEGMSLVVPPQDRWYQMSLFVLTNYTTGTAAVAAAAQINTVITDYTGTSKTVRASSTDMIQVTTTSKVRNVSLEFASDPLPPNDVTRYYKLQTRLAAAAPASWGGAQLFADDPDLGGFWGSMKLMAVSL